MKTTIYFVAKSLFLAFFALASARAYGQLPAEKIESVTVLADRNRLNVYGFVKKSLDTLDCTSLHVIYRLTYKPATDKSPQEYDQVLLIGNKFTRFYSSVYERLDSVTTECFHRNGRDIFYQQAFLEPTGEIYRNIAANEFQVQQRLPFQKGYIVSYTETATHPTWKITEETDSLGSYQCFKATGEYGGRTWTVWYTPEIPVHAGPWKLFGLPGLIIRATDGTECYDFKLQSLCQAKLPIVQFMLPLKIQTKQKWLRTECGFHGSPAFYFRNEGKAVFFEQGSSVELGKNWRVDYNPIEWPESN